MFKPENVQGLLEPEILLLIFIKNTSLHFLSFPFIIFIQNSLWLIYGIFYDNNPNTIIISLTLYNKSILEEFQEFFSDVHCWK